MLKLNKISLATEDKELYKKLLSLKLDGVQIYPELRKDIGVDVQTAVVNLAVTSIPLFAKWIWDYFRKNPTKKATINERPIPNQMIEITILIQSELKVHNYTTEEKKD